MGEVIRLGTVRLVIADATRLGAEILEFALSHFRRQFEVVASVSNSSDLVRAVEEHHPDVALISSDLEDGRMAGLNATRRLLAQCPALSIVILLDTHERDVVVDAFRSGAKGVVCRVEPLSSLRKCVRAVYEGQVWAGTREMHEILAALSTAVPLRVVNANGTELLTPRQRQMVRLLTEGLTNREIAEHLQLSEHTVKNYMFRIFDKLGVSSRSELIIYALNQNQRAS
jgi:DNA-binding NarL/FixJ family response regulator